tara:strand:- start:127 stop:492 length:366 start_codon:yes stop_codon:yes gene_type:complete
MTRCPYCRKPLREHEVYCDFCEEDTTKKIKKKKIKPKISQKSKIFEGLETRSQSAVKAATRTIPKPKKEEPKIIAYCVKCRKKVTVKNPKDYTMKNKRAAIKGVCPVCKTKVFRIIGMKKK